MLIFEAWTDLGVNSFGAINPVYPTPQSLTKLNLQGFGVHSKSDAVRACANEKRKTPNVQLTFRVSDCE